MSQEEYVYIRVHKAKKFESTDSDYRGYSFNARILFNNERPKQMWRKNKPIRIERIRYNRCGGKIVSC